MHQNRLVILIFNLFLIKIVYAANFHPLQEIRGLVSNSKPSRAIGQPGHLAARKYLIDRIKQLDRNHQDHLQIQSFKPQIDKAKLLYENDLKDFLNLGTSNLALVEKNKNFTQHMIQKLDQIRDISGENIIWFKPGKTKKLIVVTAHYDTISHDKETLLIKDEATPGADYNASGVAMGLGVIQHFASLPKSFNHGLMVVFLDYSTLGFLGAQALIDEAIKADQKVLLNINLTMLGFDSVTQDQDKKYGNMKAYVSIEGKATFGIEKIFFDLMMKANSKTSKNINFELLANGFNQSDHVRFWERGIPALVLSQNWQKDFNYRLYQTPQDLPEFLNQDTLHGAYRWLTDGLLSLLN